MILQFRKFSKSIFAAIILGLVGLAMVLWLPSGQFSTLTATEVLKVGKYAVTPQQLTRDLQSQLRNLREERGQVITQQEAVDGGLHNQVLDQLATRLSLYAYADRIGVGASDRQVADQIRSYPQVLNPVTRQFDPMAYTSFLRQIEYTQTEFETAVRGDLSNQMVMQSLIAGIRSPTSYGALMLTYQNETRVISVAELPVSALGAIPAPTDEQIQTFYAERADALRVPEFRQITFAIARVEDFIPRVTVDAEELAAEVETRRAVVGEPERRSYTRLTAQNEAQANDIAARLNAGEAPQSIATALGVQVTQGENQARTEVLDEAVATAVFETAAGAPARAVRGRLSPYVVVRVDNVIAPPPINTAELREQVRTAMATERAADLLHDAIGAFEEARSAGASVADAARQHGLALLTTPLITAQGLDQQGRPIEALSALTETMRSAFELPEGEATDFLPFEGGDVIAHVDRVVAATVRPLEEVREALVIGWTNRERERRLQERGAAIVEAVRAGASLQDAAREHRLTLMVRSQQVERSQAAQIPARALPGLLFQVREGEAVSDIRADGQALLVGVVERINRPDPRENPQMLEQVRMLDTRLLTNSFADSVAAEIVGQMRPRRNQRLLDRSFAPSATEE